ncbi:MAG: L-histidine N(alpha)-methyltransferase, partial [Salinisphaeraceae bacterium]|nr:L-histidine N(alpha)-methyltransferase [Salinisphaeraceae bacterium]
MSTSSALCEKPTGDIELLDLAPDTDTMLADVLEGLSQTPKSLPCKYFYDARGAQLFEQICELPEYYPTRTEIRILGNKLVDIAAAIGPGYGVIEPGSGSGIKTRLLLDALVEPTAYAPIDVASKQLLDYANDLTDSYPDIELRPICADFTQSLQLPPELAENPKRLLYFPGSTIGNFSPAAAQELLAGWRHLLGTQGKLLIGVDLKKDPTIIEAAYNDSQGITAAFNLNLMQHLNRALGTDFDLNQFKHRADYEPRSGALRMWLVSQCVQSVTIGDRLFDFKKGEAICTEHSYKYALEDFAALASTAGWSRQQSWVD